MMHKPFRHRPGCATRRCDLDQAPRGPLARRTHLTDRVVRSARCEHSVRTRPLCNALRAHPASTGAAPALEALEVGAIGAAAAANAQRRGILPRDGRAVGSAPNQADAPRSRLGRRLGDTSEVQDPSMKTAKLAVPTAQEMPTIAIQSKPCGQGPPLCERRLRRYRRRRWRASSPDGGGVTQARAGTHSPPSPAGHGRTQAG